MWVLTNQNAVSLYSDHILCPLQERLSVRVGCLLKSSTPDASFRTEKKLKIKLSGDGTNIGKRLHVVNFTFTLLDEGEAAYSSDGNHCLAIIKEPENYDSLFNALGDLRQEVASLKRIQVEGQVYDIEYFLGGDWKFLAIATGIDSVCSTYACVWRKCPSSDRFDADKTWSITDTTKGARTVKETCDLAKLPKSRRKFNVSHAPLFPDIPLDHVIIDNLHLFLRISDTLIDLVITEMKRQDAKLCCSNCKQDTHNMCTCVDPCSKCQFSPFCSHLVKVGRKNVPQCQTMSP